MSTLRVNKLESTSTTDGGISIDTSGHVTVDGQVLPSAGPLSNRNKIINGDMRIDQRNTGASVTAGSAYTLDRWNVDRVWTGTTVTIQRSTTAPSNFTNSLVATVSTGAAVAAASYFSIQQYVEGYNFADLNFGTASAKSFTVSFWVRSSATGDYGVGFRNSAFNRSYWTTYTINAADTWEYKTVTVAGDTTGTWYTDNSYGINLIFSLGCGSTSKAASNGSWQSGNKLGAVGQTDLIATTGATFYITGVQLEVGSVATPFEHRSYGDELARCQRYFTLLGGSNGAYDTMSTGGANTSTTAYIPHRLPVTMRAAPSLTFGGSASDFRYSRNNTDVAPSALALDVSAPNMVTVNMTGSSLTVNAAVRMFNVNTTGSLQISAEL